MLFLLKDIFVFSKHSNISFSFISFLFLLYQTTHQIYSISHLPLSSLILSHLLLSSYFLLTTKHIISLLFRLLPPSKLIWVVLKVKTSNFNMFGSAFQNQFSSPIAAILVEATIPSF